MNLERFGERRSELYYQMLDQQYYTMPETVDIPAGEYVATLPINFTLGGENNANSLDMSDKYILPLTIVDDPSYDYQSNDRLHYRKALLNVIPFMIIQARMMGVNLRLLWKGKRTLLR